MAVVLVDSAHPSSCLEAGLHQQRAEVLLACAGTGRLAALPALGLCKKVTSMWCSCCCAWEITSMPYELSPDYKTEQG